MGDPTTDAAHPRDGSDDDPQNSALLVVGIGASAGGLEAVSLLLSHLPGDPGLAFVVVQHLDPAHESSLVQLLSRVSPIPVHEASEGRTVESDHVYVIPPNTSMILKDGSLHLRPREETKEGRRPVDLFLRSLAEEQRDKSIGVILSGTGSDGTYGLEAIQAEGGITFAQDTSAAYSGMPTSAASAGCADYVLSPEAIANELVRIRRNPSVISRSASEEESPPAADAGETYDAVVRRLSEVSGLDFSNYKQATLRRRIHRRMVVSRRERIEDYCALLDEDRGEAAALCEDVLINVTSFFRDTEVFEALAQRVFPALLKDRPSDKPIRIWVPGCSSGEEVYSLAISLLEFLGPQAGATPIKLFGTDVSESVIARARSGRYPQERVAADVAPDRLRRFFVKEEGSYVISKAVRALCVFARQDATRDPPFSDLDLISCRNLLIYLGPVLQKRVLPFFHYALREDGFLLLGTAETVGPMAELFTVIDAPRRIYRRRSVASRLVFDAALRKHDPARSLEVPPVAPSTSQIDLQREADRVLLARCAPPGVLIDEALEILQFRGDTGPFLSPAPGAPSSDLRKMAREGLFPVLGAAIEQAKSEKATVRRAGLSITSDGRSIDAEIEVIPIGVPASAQRCFLILFRAAAPAADPVPVTPRSAAGGSQPGTEQRRISQLEQELTATKEYLGTSLEEREVANEEIRAANEELLASNEELQSTNEELQTAQEELQSTNEELLTVNEELEHRNAEARQLNDDLTNLLSSVQIPIIMVGLDLRIRRFTPSAGKLLNLIRSDLDRSILDLKPKIDVPDLEDLLLEVLETFAVKQREVQDQEGRWHSLSIRPYLSQGNKIDGAVIVLADVDAIKLSAQRLERTRDFAQTIVMAVREPLLVLDPALCVKQANDAFRETFRTVPTRIAPPGSDGLEGGSWHVPGLREKLEEIGAGSEAFEDFEVEAELPDLGRRTVRANARWVPDDGEQQPLILLVVEDVTEQRRVEAVAALLARRLEEAQRLKSLGVLAGGIAHDFNNILTAILGYAELVENGLREASPLRPWVENVKQNSLRAADLCRQMLAYAGQGRFVVQPLDLSALIRDLNPLLRAATSKNAELRLDLGESLPAVMGDAAQLRQILMNLVINASEAMGDEGGTISVRTGQMRPDRAYLESARLAAEDAREGDYVYLELADDGCGMDPETLAQVFEPFFSLKFTGRGLGLAAVLGSVRSHHGVLSVDSEPGRGSTFRILFPALVQPAEQLAPPATAATTWRGEGTVLVVDDEDAIRNLLTTMLERLGFQVLEAEDGQAAVEVFRARTTEIDVVFLDLTMPRMDGEQVFRELRKLRPDARVILMSGYDERNSMEGFTTPGLAGFLSKPFQLDDVAAKLRQAIEG